MQNLIDIIEKVKYLSFINAFFVFLILNIVQFLICIYLGSYINRHFIKIHQYKQNLNRKIIILIGITILMNSLLTMIGWIAWKKGLINPQIDSVVQTIIDFFKLFFLMDFLMFVFHRIGHIELIYKYLHKMHHQYKEPNSYILFILNPIETIGFGIIWTLVVYILQPGWISIFLFLIINLIWGTIGHCGAEPFPKWWSENKITNILTNARFHHKHHENETINFGFYTTIWDLLFIKK